MILNLEQYVVQKQHGFSEPAAREFFHKAIALHTVVINCPDLRASGAPVAVAREFGITYPGENVLDETGNKVGHTTNIGTLVTVGGRAIDALRSITILDYMIGIKKNVVVVHHSFCGLSAATPAGIINAYKHEYQRDISGVYTHEDLSIADLEHTLRHDVTLLRNASGVSKHLNIYGYCYDINTEKLIKVVEDLGE